MDKSILVDDLTLEWLIQEGQRKVDEAAAAVAAATVERERQQAEERIRTLELARGLLPKAVSPFLYFHKYDGKGYKTIVMRLNISGLAMMEVHFWGQWENPHLRIGITDLKFSSDPFKVMDYKIMRDPDADMGERYFVGLQTVLEESDLSVALAHAAKIGNRYDEIYAKAQRLTREEMEKGSAEPEAKTDRVSTGELLLSNIQDIVMQVLLDEGVL